MEKQEVTTVKKVGIINAGAWGTAIAKVIAEKGHQVQMWDFMEDVVSDINDNHANSRFLLGVDLPESITATADIQEAALDKDFLIIATPSLYILNIVKELIRVPNILEGRTTIGVLTKGFVPTEQGPKLILESMEGYLPGFYRDNLVYISGPSHAEEVSRGKLTGLVSASSNGKNSIRFRELLGGSNLIVVSSFDVTGVQVCGAVKNVIAIAFGMLDALMELSQNFGDNTESLLLAAGLNEIQSLGIALGSSYPETFTSIAGVGDLDVTCRSRFGRNRRFGREIISDRILTRFKDIEDLLKNISQIGYLPEGIAAAKYAHELASKHKLKLNIVERVYSILNREIEPLQAVKLILGNMSGDTFMQGGA